MEKWGEALGMCAVCLAFLCLCFPLGEDIRWRKPIDLVVLPQNFRSLFSNNGYETC